MSAAEQSGAPSVWGEFYKGLLPENPIIRLVLGLCPAMAVTTTAVNGLGMGLATLVVLIGSNILVALLRNVIPNNVRIPAFIVIIATFVTIIDLFMAAFTPELHAALGIFIPLIVVNCIVMGRAEAFARKNPVGRSAVDAIGMGIGFTWALVLIAGIRELLGMGSLFGFDIMGKSFQPIVMMILPPGGFLALGFIIAGINFLEGRGATKERAEREARLGEAHRKAMREDLGLDAEGVETEPAMTPSAAEPAGEAT